ncbi:MAG: glutaredoxin family protein [Rhodoferax sp.]|jgi:glutaredoxin|nr:glutaredoxin family protein [Rhodoferax sp.]
MTVTIRFWRSVAGGLVLGAACGLVAAQTIYRIVGPDGKVTFSDKPPTDATRGSATTAAGKPVAAVTEAVLPFELRQVIARYPVTLYAGAGCAPCNSGRILLQSRGIPFTEYSVATAEDAEALQRLSGANNLPFLTIGAQKIKGFSEAEWSQFLNAANYPATSLLPQNYRQPAPRPLVAVQKPPPAKAEEASGREQEKDTPQERAEPAESNDPNPSNPTGIKF